MHPGDKEKMHCKAKVLKSTDSLGLKGAGARVRGQMLSQRTSQQPEPGYTAHRKREVRER